MIEDAIVKKIYPHEFVGHGFDHVERVHKMAMKISQNEKKVDLEILDAACWFHDIARHKESQDGTCHAKEGAKMIKQILVKLNFPKEKINAVSYAIQVHRFSKGIKPKTKEAEILQDADRLDAIGAIAIARIFSFGGHKGREIYTPGVKIEKDKDTSIARFYKKQIHLNPNSFHTKTAKSIAKERYEFIKLFLKNFKQETE